MSIRVMHRWDQMHGVVLRIWTCTFFLSWDFIANISFEQSTLLILTTFDKLLTLQGDIELWGYLACCAISPLNGLYTGFLAYVWWWSLNGMLWYFTTWCPYAIAQILSSLDGFICIQGVFRLLLVISFLPWFFC